MDLSWAMQQPAQPVILVVDDFDDTRLLLRTWLERKGFEVIEAENGNEAVSQAETKRPNLIIMDLEMPELDGLAATRKIRAVKELEKVPVLAVSAYGAEQFRDDALAAGSRVLVAITAGSRPSGARPRRPAKAPS